MSVEMTDDTFRYTDPDGDRLTVTPAGMGLVLATYGKDGGSEGWAVRLADRTSVRYLHAFLGRFLGETRLPSHVATPAQLTPADVRAIVAEAIAEERARVQPLWQAPQAAEGARFCELPGCPKFPYTEKHFEHDPEPHDVGHPEPEPICDRPIPADVHQASRCTFCGWLWAQHHWEVIVPGCWLCQAPWTDGHGQPGDPCAGAPRQLIGCECGHRWGVHTRGLGCTGHGGTCTCDHTPPSEVRL
jgi:hypothetical protein